MKKFYVHLMDDSQGQDREDSDYVYTVQAETEDDACEMALRDEPANVYVISVRQVESVSVR